MRYIDNNLICQILSGYALVQIPHLLFWVHDYLKRHYNSNKSMSTKRTNVEASISLGKSTIPYRKYNCNGACLTAKERIEIRAVLAWYKKIGHDKSGKQN